ncbi:MAG: GWxTD domain-containing protein [Acidobacteriota bacterium]
MSFQKARIALAVFVLLPGLSFAAVSPEMKAWGDGPAKYWMTDEERKDWQSIDSDETAQRFIDLFWAKRDPDLEKPGNPFRARFKALVSYADENVSEPATPGSMSDRGKFLILFGPPFKIISTGRPASEVSLSKPPTIGNEVRDLQDLATQAWTWDKERLPPVATKSFRIVFTDQFSAGRYKFERHLTTSNIDDLVRKAVQQAIVHPELKSAPPPAAQTPPP